MDYNSLKLLGICINGKFFFDSTLPFGCTLSCSLFEEIASALDWALVHRTGHPICHYLDDFLFYQSTYEECEFMLNEFKRMCQFIGFPISIKKTYEPCQSLKFLGITIDTVNMVLRVPQSKHSNALTVIDDLLKRRKCQLREIQAIYGLLNFLEKCVRVGCPFLRRLYNLTKSKPLHHHVRLNSGAKRDLSLWKTFLLDFRCLWSIPSFTFVTNKELDFYTDASKKEGNGFGCFFPK